MKRILINTAFSTVCAIACFGFLDKTTNDREFAKFGLWTTFVAEMVFCTAIDISDRDRKRGVKQ